MISEERIKELAHRKAWRYKHSTGPNHSDSYTFNDMCLIDLCRAIEAEAQRVPDELVTVLPDGSAFAVVSLPLPEDHWLYAEREYKPEAVEPMDLPAPILTHALRAEIVSAMRYAIRGATDCGKISDFDPDALVQNAVYALCGPYGSAVSAAPEPVQQEAKPLGPATPEDQAIYNAMVENYEQEAEPVVKDCTTCGAVGCDHKDVSRCGEGYRLWEPRQLHPDTESLVQRFAAAMRNKLARAERKYGYSNLWMNDDWMDECREKLVEHLHKGDPLDVANYCTFLWHHGAHCKPVQQEAKPVAQCTDSDQWNCKYCDKTKTCEALKDKRNFAKPIRPTEAAIRADEREKMLAELRLLADAEGRVHLWEVE